MLKDILIKCSEILNRADITHALKSSNSIDDISNQQTQNDVIKLISFYNFVTISIFQSYIDLINTDTVVSDSSNKIYYYNLTFNPIEIISILDENNSHMSANVFSGYILTNSANKTYKVTYRYLPTEIKNFNSELNLPKIINKKIICYGIVSEFFASKNMFAESEFWKNKFMFEIFKAKTHKERRVKSTFKL